MKASHCHEAHVLHVRASETVHEAYVSHLHLLCYNDNLTISPGLQKTVVMRLCGYKQHCI